MITAVIFLIVSLIVETSLFIIQQEKRQLIEKRHKNEESFKPTLKKDHIREPSRTKKKQ